MHLMLWLTVLLLRMWMPGEGELSVRLRGHGEGKRKGEGHHTVSRGACHRHGHRNGASCGLLGGDSHGLGQRQHGGLLLGLGLDLSHTHIS